MRYLLPLALLVPGLLGGCDVVDHSATDGVSTTGEVRPSDMTDKTNSAVNARDRDSSSKTPIDQNENQKDINVTADIRKRVVDSSMSTNAKNVKIITQNGTVTLRGTVESADEKKRIEEIAQSVAGVAKVESQLEVQ